MLNIYDAQNKSLQQKLARPSHENITLDVQDIITAVKARGDQALKEYAKKWDQVDLDNISVELDAIHSAKISETENRAIQAAIENIARYHTAMLPETLNVTTANGIKLERIHRPIQRIGLYVPGGNNTCLVSSLLMQAMPALIAGCPIRVMCTPCKKDGSIDPRLLVAARLCQIETIYKIGGAQAIASLAYGTETVQKVDKIFGPGNQFVTTAKSLVAQDPNGAAIDMPAGPSEVMVVSDRNANPAFIAADLLAQAEHGSDSQAILLCETMACAVAVNTEIQRQFKQLSRQSLIKQSLEQSAIIICNSREECLQIINQYAPEHLIINRQDAEDWVKDIQNAGTIFLGPWAAETMGDYISGSNHVLPTSGYAKTYSGLSTTDFLTAISVQRISSEGIRTQGPFAQTLARIEGLDAHENAISLRLAKIRGGL